GPALCPLVEDPALGGLGRGVPGPVAARRACHARAQGGGDLSLVPPVPSPLEGRRWREAPDEGGRSGALPLALHPSPCLRHVACAPGSGTLSPKGRGDAGGAFGA